ncbi:MAG TPA: PEP/pyruvate-binding domain-containing protein [Anaerolineales bacterium]|nr:PEP/pyruvate-binding domain-containing protein [Anaerolineales bacterium]
MRRELFERGVISPQRFETEVRDRAIESQAREGLHNPFEDEPTEVWEVRLERTRSHLTDFYFAYNLPYELFEGIIRDILMERGAQADDLLVSFNPELAPQKLLFEHAKAIENLPLEKQERGDARLREIKVVLMRRMISDQLAYINIAKDWFTVSDLAEINQRKIGQGKIGGKAAGMLLALRILSEVADEEILSHISIPDSYFVGADVMYTYMSVNNLMHWNDQKYRSEEQIRAEYPQIEEEYLQGEFPSDILDELDQLLQSLDKVPLIIRSSSLLEDNFGTSFAGKYDSVFCPNQGNPEQNLNKLTQAIAQVYASTLNPDALLYRRSKGLQDYDERMAILIQVVKGEYIGQYYLPHAAGVAFSRNSFRWSPEIRSEDGFVRLVWGLGTRAVDQVGDDYPRLVALSHPLLHPEDSSKAIRRYSQQFVDVIDLEQNSFQTLPIAKVLDPHYPVLRYIAEIDQGGYLAPIRSLIREDDLEKIVLTFDQLLNRTQLADHLREVLQILETHYKAPVDTEFTVRIKDPSAIQPEAEICILQCRPQSHFKDSQAQLPKNLPEEDIIFSTSRMVPRGRVDWINYVIIVRAEDYLALPSKSARAEVGRAISKLNAALADQVFICIGPGRWGTRNLDLGVYIGYSDIYNTSALIEVSGEEIGLTPEPSFGTHFFQDLVEANIYPLAINLDDDGVIFNRNFFYDTPNHLIDFIPVNEQLSNCLRLIKVSSYRPGHCLSLVMDDELGRAAAYLVPQAEEQ